MSKLEYYSSYTTIASYFILYDYGYIIKDIQHGINDYVILLVVAGGKPVQYHKLKVYYNTKGDYIILKGIRYYLSNFIKY